MYLNIKHMTLLAEIIPVIALLIVFFQLQTARMAPLSPNDPNSYSRPDLVIVKHASLNLKADFGYKIFTGFVDLTFEKIDKDTDEIILDTQNLVINSVIDQISKDLLAYNLIDDEETKPFGTKMVIKLPTEGRNIIRIKYETSPNANGLMWLSPEQTSSGTEFVFSQFQAIAARSFVPCQDTPGVKMTYEAKISCPKQLKVVMSAVPQGEPLESEDTKTFAFKQEVPIQSYLIALAIGDLHSRKVGPRTTVHAEKAVIEESAYEFANTERQLKTAEDICGPYVWGIYDLIVLPPSFPFGGMENPCLTFVTPTLLAGDRSLVDVISHEIAHSWTGNLVTNANFEHFWLNEGFTVFIERKILGRLEGKEALDFAAYGGYTTLKETVKTLGETSPFTCLVVDLDGVHPDEAFSSVPYEKGYIFLRYLENLVGGPDAFEPFLRKYFDTYKYKSITTDVFKDFYLQHFADNAAIKSIDWETWLHKPGMPPVIPTYDQSILNEVQQKKDMYLKWDPKVTPEFPIDPKDLTSLQKIQFLQEILEIGSQPVAKLEAWAKKWNMTSVKNAEIKSSWLRIGIQAKWENIVDAALDFVNCVGRMKYTRPIYRDLYAWEDMRSKAISNFRNYKQSMMHVSAFTLGKDLHLY